MLLTNAELVAIVGDKVSLRLAREIEAATLCKAAEECDQIAAQQKRMYRDQQGAVECRNRLRALAEGK